MAIDVAVMASLFAVGTIVFGHFEAGVPKWRRVLKLAIALGATALVDAVGGRVWAWAFIAGALTFGLTVHFVVLRRHGIDPWTAEPRDRYYALRGWAR
ncbi:MAG TPA: hypothetical protein VFB07_00085 [Vicinamibacterales bacterium]|nr:hypothetical protein [Vicinamibacterales bacterium]